MPTVSVLSHNPQEKLCETHVNRKDQFVFDMLFSPIPVFQAAVADLKSLGIVQNKSNLMRLLQLIKIKGGKK